MLKLMYITNDPRVARIVEQAGVDRVFVEGIRDLTLTDIHCADEFGYKIKLLAIIKQNAEKQLEVRVHPTLVPKTSSIASISGVFNGVMVNGITRTSFGDKARYKNDKKFGG